jgi:formate/nitrite transporter FocA (FNT family)
MQFKRGYLIWALLGNFVGLAILLAVMYLVPPHHKMPITGPGQSAP